MSDNILLSVQDLHAKIEDGRELIKGLSLSIKKGETHVVMGPNGAGKSTLSNIIMGHPDYLVTDGTISFEGEDITEAKTNDRAKKGIFMSFQSPEEIDGISVSDFLLTAKAEITGGPVKSFNLKKDLEKNMEILEIDKSYSRRYLNVGYSGGEKKKNEMLQLLTLNPKLAILDETDSGLDVDAVKTVTKGIKEYKNDENSLLIISHSTKMLENLDIDKVHILVDGKIVHTSDKTLIDKINQEGFTQFL